MLQQADSLAFTGRYRGRAVKDALSRIANWSQACPFEPGLDLELISPVWINVLEASRRELKDVLVGDAMTLAA